MVNDAWLAHTYQTLELVEVRLEKRFFKMMPVLCARPLDSINQSCEDWASAKAAYRFIENKRVMPNDLIKPVTDATARDCAEYDTVLAVQDTTTLSFDSARTADGLGPISDSEKARGMLLHPSLALRLDGAPIGLLDLHYWCRDPEVTIDKPDNRPIEEKESYKWINGMIASRQALDRNIPEDQHVRMIHVMDREGDIIDVHNLCKESDDGLVVRCNHNRIVKDREGREVLAHDAVAATPSLGTVKIDVPRKKNQPERTATVDIRSCSLRLPYKKIGSPRELINLNLVEIKEVKEPKNAEPLRWILWTTEPAATLNDALEIVRIYKLRWKIEEFNLILKSGCRIEKVQFETADRLAKVVAIYAPIAVRILQLRDWSRLEPDESCEKIVTPDQWHALYTVFNGEPPKSGIPPPTIKQVTLWIGKLGGHLGRKSDGMPGVRTLWRGWRDLELLVIMYKIFSAQ